MVHDINGWVFSKKTSERNSPDEKKHKQFERGEYSQTPAEKKTRKVDYKSTKVSRVNGSNFTEVFAEQAEETECGKKYYAAIPKRNKYKFLKHSNKETSNTINCIRKSPDFSSLRQEIASFEHRAK